MRHMGPFCSTTRRNYASLHRFSIPKNQSKQFLSPADDERPAEIVIINPVSRQYMYCSKQEFAVRWEKQ